MEVKSGNSQRSTVFRLIPAPAFCLLPPCRRRHLRHRMAPVLLLPIPQILLTPWNTSPTTTLAFLPGTIPSTTSLRICNLFGRRILCFTASPSVRMTICCSSTTSLKATRTTSKYSHLFMFCYLSDSPALRLSVLSRLFLSCHLPHLWVLLWSAPRPC